MMKPDLAIKVENLSKIYELYDNNVDRLKESVHPFRKKYHRDFYALKDVSFEVKKAEIVGIIGKNGSGKSTLLKILAGVLSPTSGTVAVNGRVSALLELGTGFNPELTGVENIYFSGTIMGYSKVVMDAKLDDILSFADIGQFAYQPIKIYSSGMFSRLAFAVAINIDPDIFIVDEALAVGDARFVKKCYEKMDSFCASGKTILLVSHDVNTIKSMTKKAILLHEGSIFYQGDPLKSAIQYMKLLFPGEYITKSIEDRNDKHYGSTEGDSEMNLADKTEKYVYTINADAHNKYWGIGGGRVSAVNIYGLQEPNIFHGGEVLDIELSCEWDKEFIQSQIIEKQLYPNIIIGITIQNKQNITISSCNTYEMGHFLDPLATDREVVRFSVKMPLLASNEYFISPAIAIGTQENHVQLKWTEVLVLLQCISKKKYIFGLMYFDAELTNTNS
jgi:teichoic acid transport system ATP-binding protein